MNAAHIRPMYLAVSYPSQFSAEQYSCRMHIASTTFLSSPFTLFFLSSFTPSSSLLPLPSIYLRLFRNLFLFHHLCLIIIVLYFHILHLLLPLLLIWLLPHLSPPPFHPLLHVPLDPRFLSFLNYPKPHSSVFRVLEG
jgi:hypothetical protein